MFSDSYVEQAFRAKPAGDYYVKLFLSVLLAVAGCGAVFFSVLIGFVLFLAGICLFFYFMGNRNMEYEYILTNGGVEIAAIYNASKRKELMSFELDQVTMIVPKDSNRIATETFARKRDYTSRTGDGKVISFVVEQNGSKELVMMEPNEKILAHVKNYARNKMYDIYI